MSLRTAGGLSQHAQTSSISGQQWVLQPKADGNTISCREGRGTLLTRMNSDWAKGNKHLMTLVPRRNAISRSSPWWKKGTGFQAELDHLILLPLTLNTPLKNNLIEEDCKVRNRFSCWFPHFRSLQLEETDVQKLHLLVAFQEACKVLAGYSRQLVMILQSLLNPLIFG